jgi:hypothetical protein
MKHSSKKQSEKYQHDPEIDDLLTRLEGASKRLNVAARQAARRIESLEERLVAADPGLEIWGPILLREPTTFQREEGSATEAAERVVTLGYAKVKKDRWGFAAREVVRATGGARLSEATLLLHKAERNVRLRALPHLTALTRQIVEAVEAQTVGLEDGADDDVNESTEHADQFAHAEN